MKEDIDYKKMLRSMLRTVTIYRLEHSMREAGENRSEYNDAYVNMLQECGRVAIILSKQDTFRRTPHADGTSVR